MVGLGGVGSWAAEALVRSGVAALTLVDMDHVAESNFNRQVQALHTTLGMSKAKALEARFRDIAPECRVSLIDDFVTSENARDILQDASVSVWIDATDDLSAKKAMIFFMAQTRRLKDLVVCGGAGGKTSCDRIESADLSDTTHDPLLSALRYDLRRSHGFARTGKMNIQTIFSPQPMIKSEDCDPRAKLACAGYGSLVTVTASMGFLAAENAMKRAIKKLVSKN